MILMGDFNAHLHGRQFRKTLDVRGLELDYFLNSNNLVSINTLVSCAGAGSTFVTYDGLHESLIDHVVMSTEWLDTVSSCEILDDCVLNVSRHRPIVFSLKLPETGDVVPNDDFLPRINWKKSRQEHIESYQSALSQHLQTISPELTTPQLTTADIDGLYVKLVESMQLSSDRYIPKSKVS